MVERNRFLSVLTHLVLLLGVAIVVFQTMRGSGMPISTIGSL